jgi:proline iminopeptidase
VVYPVTEPISSGWLDVGDGQRLYYEEAGNPEGVPAVVLHGGPGSGFSPSLRQFFDPSRYRIICFDQRGAGKSLPNAGDDGADMSVNTTAHLIADIEWLRRHFEVERWVIYGQSCGVTLGLAYAEAHPASVKAMVLAAVTTTSHKEVDYLFGGGIAAQFPEAWAKLRGIVPAGTPDTGVMAALSKLLHDADPAVRETASIAFHKWDWITVSGNPDAPWSERWNDAAYRMQRARIVTHYFGHYGFLGNGQLIADGHRLQGIPGVLIQGRQDLQSPTLTAEAVAAAWPGAELVTVEDAGHSSGDGGMPDAITSALDRFVRR